MSITVQTANGPVVAKELLGDYSKGIPEGGAFVQKKYLVPWADSNAFANAIMGIGGSVIGGVNGTIIRTLSHQCPEVSNLYAASVGNIEPFGAPIIDGGRPRWASAIVPVLYGQPTYTLGEGANNTVDPQNLFTPDNQTYEFCSFKITYGSEFLTLPETSYKYASSIGGGSLIGKTVGHPIGVRIATATIICTVHKVPWLPFNALLDLQGCVNNGVFFGRLPGKILFDGADTNIVLNSDGTATMDIEETYKYRSVGWNSAPNPTNGKSFETITHDGTLTGDRPYTESDLRPLIFGVFLT